MDITMKRFKQSSLLILISIFLSIGIAKSQSKSDTCGIDGEAFQFKHGQFRGCTYTGQWGNCSLYGEGKMVYTNGEIYQGSWVNSKREGHGIIKYPDGGYYDGQWLNN